MPSARLLALVLGLGIVAGAPLRRPRLSAWRGGAAGGLSEHRRRPGLVGAERAYDGIPIHAAPERVREQFVERVYGTLSMQLLATMALCWYALTHQPRALVNILRSSGLTLAAIVSPMLVTTAISSSPGARKSPFWAYAFLALFTASEALVLSLVMLFVPREVVLRAGVTTAAVVGWLSLYARATRRNFTRTGPTIVRGLCALVVLELLQITFFRRSPLLHSLYSAGGALACAALLVVNTQQIVGGTSQHATIAPDEHVLASILLYTDIVALFIRLMELMGGGASGGWRSRDEDEEERRGGFMDL
ncbi:hypothetical protein KFE25_010521 [Diacronema lutheri]|uniref:Uncharacterized protein n=1 Tax=Diacronema lutheri TaxID=2081491 RepID=A0A8J6C5S5_DIALT|nr:hypothetical protein KFE25_010521 [Diacronema lutheri]